MQDFIIPACTVCATKDLILSDTLPACIGERVSQDEVTCAGRYGQIHPLLAGRVAAHDSRLQVLSGFAAFLALKNAGLDWIACRILPQETPPASAFALRILHDHQACQSSPILQAWLLQEAHEQLPAQDVLSLLPLMGLKPRPHVVEERIRLLQVDHLVQTALHNQELHLRNLTPLLRLPKEEQKRLVELIRQYHLGGSKQHKLVELAVDLCLGKGRSIEGMLAEWQRSDPPRENLPQESQSLLAFLQVLSNPRLAQAEAQFDEHLRSLRPPPRVSVSHTPAFEDEQISVQLSYSSWSAVQAHWQKILNAVEREYQGQ